MKTSLRNPSGIPRLTFACVSPTHDKSDLLMGLTRGMSEPILRMHGLGIAHYLMPSQSTPGPD